MRPDRDQKFVVLVEGGDDKYVIDALLTSWAVDSRPIVKYARGDANLPTLMRDHLKSEKLASLAVVIDADQTAAETRWESLRGSVPLLQQLATGWRHVPFEDTVTREDGLPNIKFGLWMMPDNQNSGTLEDFLRPLIPTSDIWTFAQEASEEAKSKGAEFSDTKLVKAQLHTWLAWQKKPALRPGKALKAGYFLSAAKDGNVENFLQWLKRMRP